MSRNDSKYFSTTKKGEIPELKEKLILGTGLDVINSNPFLYQTPQNLRELNHLYNDGGNRGSSRSNNEIMLFKYEPLSFSLLTNKNNQNQMSVHHP
ncbi:hypothetical protein MTR_7g100250 [Medicago truncatula]|uniref:Uncharacterized protein n=1 Tax=Medicago truncatula TaxID=3880 RepID=G7L0P1_MEDTR|nr:hypothetical protein MTR_7g100250 [Medicago truncatula]